MCLALLLLFAGIGADLDVIPLSARQIAERAREHWTRHDTSASMRIRVIGRTGRTLERRLEAARMRVGGQPRSLIRMTHPPDLRGTTLLVLENEARADDRFLYLPSSRRIRRIAASRGGDRFLGTDFSYEDLGAVDLDAQNYELLPSQIEAGVSCYVIESVRSDTGDRSDLRRAWISRDRLVTLRVEYERRGRVVRRLQISPESLQQIGPEAWVPRVLVMRDLIRGTRTEIVVEGIAADPDLAEDLFTFARLERLAGRGPIHTDEHSDEQPPDPPVQP